MWPDEIQDERAGFFFSFIREKKHAFLSTIFASFISVRLTAPSNITNLPRKLSQNFSFNLRVYLHSKQFARLSLNKNSTKLHCLPSSDRTKKPSLKMFCFDQFSLWRFIFISITTRCPFKRFKESYLGLHAK